MGIRDRPETVMNKNNTVQVRKETNMETIISACISAGVTLLVCMINSRNQQARADEQQRETRALLEYKLEELTKRVDKHNNVVERTYVLEEKVKVANHRLDDLERRSE
ncbi:MAG: hypothetical protein MRZ45_02180 [Blautia sp.]|nr:hypothetical protein [Blautia sp.]